MPTGTTSRSRVISNVGQSPRVFPIPLYDPDIYQNGKQNGRTADLISRNWLGFFVEDVAGNEVLRTARAHLGVSSTPASRWHLTACIPAQSGW